MAGSTTLDSFMADLGALITKHFAEEAPDEDQDLYEDEDEESEEGEAEEGDEEEDEDEDEAEEPADEAEDDEGDDGEDEDDEGEEYSRDELEEMGLRQLRSLARETGYSTADLKGYDKDALVSLLLGEEEEEADE